VNIDDIIAGVLSNEGGYSNNPNDQGGATNFGITQKVARAFGFMGDMHNLSKETAINIYRKQYVDDPGFGLILPMSEGIAAELVDTGVNMGPNAAGKFLQRALNVLTDTRLVVDGACGPATRSALQAFLTKRPDDGEQLMLKALNCLQGSRYIEIAEANPTQKIFVAGWLRARVNI